MGRKEELEDVFKGIDQDTKKLIEPLIEEVVFLEEHMRKLKKIPFIRSNPNNLAQQKATAAAKQYKECSQSYMNAVRILCSLLNKQDNSAGSELLERLKGFEL